MQSARIDPILVAIAEASQDNTMVLALDGTIQFINWTVPELTRDQVIGTSVLRYVAEEFHAGIKRCLAQVQETAKPDRYETFYVSGTGAVSFWESRVAPILRDGRVANFVVSSHNVTEGRTREAEQRRFFDLSLDVLCVAQHGRFKRVNPAFARVLGYSEAELIAKEPCLELIHPDDRDPTRAVVEGLLAGHDVLDFQNRYRRNDGAYRVLSWRATAETRGGLIYAIGRDVTDRLALEAQLRQSQKMDAIGQLAGGIAHDFNNLLLVIQFNSSFALKAPLEAAGPLAEIEHAADRAAALTRQLLMFSRQHPVDTRPTDLNILLTDLMKMLRRVIDESIEIEHVAAPVEAIHCVPTQIEQVILNLCVNARDAMPNGGRITITTEMANLDDAFGDLYSWAKTGRFARLTVSDDGCGMADDVKEHAFEPFFTTKDVGKGTGLGLATVYGIVTQHAGFIHLSSEPNKGTSLQIYLPTVTRDSVDIGNIPEPADGGRELILVAEDEELVRRGVVRVLEQAGYRVLVAKDGAEAVRLFGERADEIGLVLLDLVMPIKSGREASREIRARRPDVNLLFTSGYSDLTRHGVDELHEPSRMLSKPYQSETLLRYVRSALDRR